MRVSLVEPTSVRSAPGQVIQTGAQSLPAYAAALLRCLAAFARARERGFAPMAVAQTILQIVEQEAPRLCYPVGRQAALLSMLRRLLPERAFEAMVRTMLQVS